MDRSLMKKLLVAVPGRAGIVLLVDSCRLPQRNSCSQVQGDSEADETSCSSGPLPLPPMMGEANTSPGMSNLSAAARGFSVLAGHVGAAGYGCSPTHTPWSVSHRDGPKLVGAGSSREQRSMKEDGSPRCWIGPTPPHPACKTFRFSLTSGRLSGGEREEEESFNPALCASTGLRAEHQGGRGHQILI